MNSFLRSFILLSAISTSLYAQKSLTNSRTSGSYTYIYKLTDKETFEIASKSTKVINDAFLHTLVDSFYNVKSNVYPKKLPFGNYLKVKPLGNKLAYNLAPVNNVNINIITNFHDLQLSVSDLTGNMIADAIVKVDNRKQLKYHPDTRLYSSASSAAEGVITVSHNGITNFFTYEENQYYKPQPEPSFLSRLLKPKKHKRYRKPQKQQLPRYKGYMVMNKPKFRPLDTLKFKTYLVKANGKAIENKTLKVELERNGPKDIVYLTTLKPYYEGGYEYSFLLSDTLNLKLDRSYTVVLKEQDQKDWKEVYRQSFIYEDYELKAINFSVRTSDTEHGPGKPLTIYMKAVDENDLAVPDGRVEVLVRSGSISDFRGASVFVKDTLWKTSVVLDPVGETKLVVPEHIFPEAGLNYNIHFDFLNSNNEKKTDVKYVAYRIKPQQIKTELRQDSLHLSYLLNGKSVPRDAVIFPAYADQETGDSLKVTLPFVMKLNYAFSHYRITTSDGFTENIAPEDLNLNISVQAFQSKDSLTVTVQNANKIPFWYTIFSGKSVLQKGFATQLDTVFKHSSARRAEVSIAYLGQELRTAQASASYAPNLLNVELLGPDVVYPGEKVNMQVKVTDINGRPEAATDVTAYAFTSKFKNPQTPQVPFFNKHYAIRKPRPLIVAEDIVNSGQMPLNWDKWSKAMNLDTVEYYRFLNTKELYVNVEAGNDPHKASFAPFIVKNGVIEPVQIIYVDDEPIYFSQADQPTQYGFWLKPGYHDISLRTADHLVKLGNYEFQKGKRTVISIAADLNNSKATVTSVPSKMTSEESILLSKYMIRVTNNFENQKAVINSVNNSTLLNLPSYAPNSTFENKGKNKTGSLLFGPFPGAFLRFKSGLTDHSFAMERDYTYTFEPGLIKQKSHPKEEAFDAELSHKANGNDNYKQHPIKPEDIDSIWNSYIDLRSRNHFFQNHDSFWPDRGRVVMKLHPDLAEKHQVRNIIIAKQGEPQFLQVYSGLTNHFSALDEGIYRVMYLFDDNQYFITSPITVKPWGVNYFEWKDVPVQKADTVSKRIITELRTATSDKKGFTANDLRYRLSTLIYDKFMEPIRFNTRTHGRLVDAKTKKPLAGAMVMVKGTGKVFQVDENGYFEVFAPEQGNLIFSYIGYASRKIKVTKGDMGEVLLKEGDASLNEVVVMGYAPKTRMVVTGATTRSKDIPVENVDQLLQGKVAGIDVQKGTVAYGQLGTVNIRGMSGVEDYKIHSGLPPLIIVDGRPFNGDINSIDKSLISSISILKAAEATAIYGARGAAGVIIVKTNGGKAQMNANGELVQQQQTMRTNFSDYAIWQPRLLTDQEGMAAFTVKFPDDITNWTTKLIAMNGRKQSGIGQANIKSFKMLSANFVSPLFAVVGDSINVIGKLMNYSNVEESAVRTLSYNGTDVLNGSVKFKNAHIDTVTITAGSNGKQIAADSLSFEYTMKQETGYFDGELRKIPLVKAGVMETKGYFQALVGDTTLSYNFDQELGKVTLRAEASVFPTLLDEMEKLRNYEYLCNEQLASKLKSLLLEKKVRAYLGEEFKEEDNIKKIIEKLNKNKRPEGTWGWWQNSNEELWISLHVVESLLQAKQQGYSVSLDQQKLYDYIVDKMINQKHFDQIYGIRLLLLLNEKHVVKDWIEAVEKNRVELAEKNLADRKRNPSTIVYKQPLYEQLQIIQLKQKAGMRVDLTWLLSQKKETMFGNSYWGEEGNRFWDNSIQNTLLAYQILKTAGWDKLQLNAITRYFLEQRKDGQWRNTFESSLILETILPELMVDNKKPEPASISLNNAENITVFPFSKVIDPGTLKLSKKGSAPVYFTAYQQFHNPKPEKVSKDFTVETSLTQKGTEVTRLKAGVSTMMNVRVDVRADADYVMIEIPIPAGCSYEKKIQSFWGVETHREYFKHKTSIFCTKLKKGKYNFSIELLPRYSGSYVLNPAKAEMMYFPVFYGREEMKRVGVN